MTTSVAKLKRYRARFGWVFLLSFGALLVSLWFLAQSGAFTTQMMDMEDGGGSGRPERESRLPTVLSIASLITSTTSLIGFFFTTLVAWRKERRQQQHAGIDLEKKKLELEELRLDVERKKREASPTGESPDGTP